VHEDLPYNHEGLLVHRLFLWLAIHAPWSRRWIAALDDRIGNGNVNWVKRWWQDLEVVGGRTVKPKQANARDLDLARRLDPAKQKMAYYPASMMPPADAKEPFPVDRKRALKMAERLETPAGAEARRRAGGPRPAIYQPPPPKGAG
jgi:hypothetical protein